MTPYERLIMTPCPAPDYRQLSARQSAPAAEFIRRFVESGQPAVRVTGYGEGELSRIRGGLYNAAQKAGYPVHCVISDGQLYLVSASSS